MTTDVTRGVDYSLFPGSDDEPMAETTANAVQMIDLIYALQNLLQSQGRTQAVVGGNQLLYYNEQNGWEHLSPDVYVGLDMRPHPRPSWKTWEEGKAPDIVFEITSASTESNDLSEQGKGKRRLYAELGVREYYVYDPQLVMDPPLRGFELRNGRLMPLRALLNGGVVSPLLQTELRPMLMPSTEWKEAGTYLRVIDSRTGQPFSTSDEVYHDFHASQARLEQEEQARRAAEIQAMAVEQALRAEEQARRAAEERVARMETALHEALAVLARQSGQSRQPEDGASQ